MPRYLFTLLQARYRVVGTFGNIRLGVDIAEAVGCLDHNLRRWIFQRIFIHMVAFAVGVVSVIFLAQDTKVETRKVHIATNIRYLRVVW